ncbi:hypothetical protein [Cellulomonas sp. ICMP 17802]|uniref:hypothetical protein n=1 Tax=Cellulomonas sp. ICMP 17802 TaxID=3239199 RepID=UPI00351B3344
MNEAQRVGGHWVLPTLESNTGGVARLHVSIAVGEVDQLSGQPVAVSLRAGDQELPVLEAPDPGAYYHLETIAVTAVADFAFANPDGLVPDTITVTLGDESASWPAELRGDPGSPLVG